MSILNLKENEWVLINEILLNLYASDDIKSVENEFLRMIRRIIPYNSAAFTIIDDESKKIRKDESVFIDVDVNFVNLYNDYYVNLDYANQVLTYTKSTAYKDSDIISKNAKKKTEFYQGFLGACCSRYTAALRRIWSV